MAACVLLPLAGASSASGSFLSEGHISLPTQASFSFRPLAIFNDEPTQLASTSLSASEATIRVLERRYVNVETPIDTFSIFAGDGEESSSRSNVQVTFVPTGNGGFGIYPLAGNASLVATEGTTLESASWSDIGNGQFSPGEQREGPYESLQFYRKVVDGPHLGANATGQLGFSGDGMIYAMGFDLTVRSQEGTRTYRTGVQYGDSPGNTEVVYRWAIIEFRQGSVSSAARSSWVFAAETSDVVASGDVIFTPITGFLETLDRRYLAEGTVATLRGDLVVQLAPAVSNENLLMRINVDGEIVSSTLASQPIPLAARLAQIPGHAGFLIGFGAVLTFAGGALASRMWYGTQRQRPAPIRGIPKLAAAELAAPMDAPSPFSVEDCCDAGALAASEEDWASAAKWFLRAHEMAPTSARICADLAFALSQIGDVDEALRYYGEASRLSNDGEADFNAALAAMHAGLPVEDVEVLLERALARSPELVVPLDGDRDFLALQGRARYEAAVREAWRRLQKPRGGASLA